MGRSADPTDRDVLRHDAYGAPSKLEARQMMWSFVDRTFDTGRIYSVLDLTGRETVVDIGCGNGRDLIALRSDGHEGIVVGVDLSKGMLASVPTDVALRVNGEAARLPLRPSCADVVCAMHMLYHVPDIRGALSEAGRILRPGGTLVCSTNSEHAMLELIEPWSAAMESVGAPPLERQSHAAFSVESAEPLLRETFASVDLHAVEMVARVPSADVVRNYVASTVDLYRPTLPDPTSWSAVLATVHRHASDVIRRHGTFDVTQRAGIFVCR